MNIIHLVVSIRSTFLSNGEAHRTYGYHELILLRHLIDTI